MMNIATLTLNPTIDIAYVVEHLVHTDKVRTPPQIVDPGGGGLNVARVFVRMGGNARCIYLSGGSTGIALDALLDLHQLVLEKVDISGETRISTVICEKASGREYRIVPAGPEVTQHEWEACLQRIGKVQCDYLVMSGSLPRGVPPNFYAQAAAIADKHGIRTVLDTSGEALAAGVEGGGLELIKPNLKEFQQLVGEELIDTQAIGDAAQQIAACAAARLVAVSMGERGGVLATKDGVRYLAAPTVKTKSAVGAGDSCVAAMVFGLASGMSDQDAFKLGIAGGAAALITSGTGLATAHDIEQLYQRSTASD
ncbi:1-phosphofructokinase family hexose kinase [Altererythrobacter lutimaris]|uniref:Phosphofructokinase n=1 Tax=Altererythrobacter lutimaris TaxID=2743979 RepID=A0A850HFF7_9SPHN|nr:1-phosphofructokinase family hexose kinase [Altererythrobacter lutimaris]NVE96021.1 1-phosphofructokinase family hexose kinase [Altererythrobacter lutimaris]